MLFIRPVCQNDIADLLELAGKAGDGMTSLPRCEQSLLEKIVRSENSFVEGPGSADDYFLLVMEDSDKHKVVGTSAVYSRTGARQAFYAYRQMTISHFSHSLQRQVRSELLHLTNDYTDCSEVGTLFIDPAYRGNGRWLAQARYLLMAQFPYRFAPYLIAELRGWLDDNGHSPFWDAIGQHFFQMDYAEADRLCGIGSNLFITELMPKYPIYTSMLPEAARAVIGKPHRDGTRAMALLLEEGFQYENMIDIFDGGPMLRARVDNLRSVRAMKRGVAREAAGRLESVPSLIATSHIENYRAVYQPLVVSNDNEIFLDAGTLNALAVRNGDQLRFIQEEKL